MSAAELLLIFAVVLHFDEALTLVSSCFLVKQERTAVSLSVWSCPSSCVSCFCLIFAKRGQLIMHHDEAISLCAGPGL